SRPTGPSPTWLSSSVHQTLPRLREGTRRSRGDGACLAPTHRLEAIEAVHRSRARRHERHLRRLAAVRADHVVHDPRAAAAVAVRLASRSPAFRATPGLVLQPA